MIPRYLRKSGTSIVMDYSPILAKRKDMIPCDVKGNAVHEPAPVVPYEDPNPTLLNPVKSKPKALKKTQE
jgi:hypothetical protein